MLTKEQADEVWESQLFAEVRSLYFGDLASYFSQRKQWITGLTFFLSSGAAATLIAKMQVWVPILFSVIVALMSAYAVSVNLDSKIRTMAKLHYEWNRLSNDYERLWVHNYSDEAEAILVDLQRRETEISEMASTEAPNDPKRMARWEDRVFELRRLERA